MTTTSKSDRDAAIEYASGVNGGEYSDDYGVRLYSFMSGIQHGREEERQRAKVLLDANKMAREGVDDPDAVAASIGRKKYSNKGFQKLSEKGKRRHANEKEKDH